MVMPMTNNMHIISEITPFYVKYKDIKEKDPIQSIVLMWQIGEILNRYIISTGLKPHTLFRDLYGKSETSTNTQQKSYIAREFQGRCYRVYHIFKNIEEIQSNLKGLKSVTVFREAMPFFDNEKYKMDRQSLYALLTDPRKNNNTVFNEIKQLQTTLIGKKNPRTQKLAEMDDEINCFKEFYQYILSFIKIKDFSAATKKFGAETNLNKQQIRELAKNTEQLALSNVQHTAIAFSSDSTSVAEYIKTIEALLSPKNIKKLRRFKRLINSKYVLLLTDMLNSLVDEDTYSVLIGKLNS